MHGLRISSFAGGRTKRWLSAWHYYLISAENPVPLPIKLIYAFFTALAVLVILAGSMFPTSP